MFLWGRFFISDTFGLNKMYESCESLEVLVQNCSDALKTPFIATSYTTVLHIIFEIFTTAE